MMKSIKNLMKKQMDKLLIPKLAIQTNFENHKMIDDTKVEMTIFETLMKKEMKLLT